MPQLLLWCINFSSCCSGLELNCWGKTLHYILMECWVQQPDVSFILSVKLEECDIFYWNINYNGLPSLSPPLQSFNMPQLKCPILFYLNSLSLILQHEAVSSVNHSLMVGPQQISHSVTQCKLYSFKFLYNEFLTMRNRISVALQKLTEYSRSESTAKT